MSGRQVISMPKVGRRAVGGKYLYKMATPRDIEFPELYTTTVVTWIAHVDESTGKTKATYEIIIGLQVWIG